MCLVEVSIFRRQVAVVILSLATMIIDSSTEDRLRLLPNDPMAMVGDDLVLTCSLIQADLNPEDVSFELAFRNEPALRFPVPVNDTRILNQTCVEVTLHNLTDNYNDATVFCGCNEPGKNSEDLEEDSQMLNVGRFPAEPTINFYRYYNLSQFVFRWNTTGRNIVKTQYTAWFKSTKDADFTPCNLPCTNCDDAKNPCVKQNETTCTIPFAILRSHRVTFDDFISFKVNGSNDFGTVTTDVTTFLITKYAVLSPPDRLKVRPINHNSDELTFTSKNRVMKYQVIVKSTENQGDIRRYGTRDVRFQSANLNYLRMENLTPNTRYTLSIRAMYYLSEVWSDRNSVTFFSHEEVPSKAPSVCDSCFEVTEDSQNIRTIRIFFTPLTKTESRGVIWYNLRFRSSAGMNQTTQLISLPPHNRTNEFFQFTVPKLQKDTGYTFDLYGNTSAGDGPITTITVPSVSHTPPFTSNCSAMLNGNNSNSNIIFRWNNNSRIVTVFWCKGSGMKTRCEQPAEWSEAPLSATSLDVSLSDTYESYRFGIGSSSARGNSSGINWNCRFYDKNRVAAAPSIRATKIEPTAVELQLVEPPYTALDGLVYGYNLYYVSGHEQGLRREKKVYVDIKGFVRVEGLVRGTTYVFMAESLTLAGSSFSNSTERLSTKPFEFTSSEITLIAIGLAILGLMALLGCVCCIRWPQHKIRNWIKNLQPCMPPVMIPDKPGESEKYSSSAEGYSSPSESKPLYLTETLSDEDWHDNCSSHSDPTMQPYSRILNNNNNNKVAIHFKSPDADTIINDDSMSQSILPPLRPLPDITHTSHLLESSVDTVSEKEVVISTDSNCETSKSEPLDDVSPLASDYHSCGRRISVEKRRPDSVATVVDIGETRILPNATSCSLPKCVLPRSPHAVCSDLFNSILPHNIDVVVDSENPAQDQTVIDVSSIHTISLSQRILPEPTESRNPETSFNRPRHVSVVLRDTITREESMETDSEAGEPRTLCVDLSLKAVPIEESSSTFSGSSTSGDEASRTTIDCTSVWQGRASTDEDEGVYL